MRFNFIGQTTAQRRELILTASPIKTLLILSLPALMMAMLQAMMPFTDGLFINRLTDHVTASAVSFSQPIISIVLALGQGLSVGATAIIGQLNGRGDIDESRKTATQIFVFAFFLGLISIPILFILGTVISYSLKSEIAPLVFRYISLYCLVMPFSFMESIYNGIKNANGKPEAPFFRMIIMLIIKIIGNLIFLYFLSMKIDGCVLASLLANIVVAAWMFYDLFIKNTPDKLTLKQFKFLPSSIHELLRVGFPAMINYAFIYVGFFLINREMEPYGAVVLNGQSIASNISTICFNIPGCFSAAVTTMVSMNIGSGNPGKAKRSCLLGCITSAISGAVLIAIIVPSSAYLVSMFKPEMPQIGEIAVKALHIYTYSVIGFGVCMTIQGAFIGLGKTKVPLMLGILRIWLLRYIFIITTEKYLSYYSIYWGNLFSNVTAGLIAVILILNTKWVSGIKK
ncbi:MATE family efflux transporter [Treponema putidum]|uniref:Multidrug-efflux transporter n=1 Tax=Treponema putidum TaxID=221027 RepID=A0AAE9SK95_9SPIR|nr:MATE family efflux transporter [Treponema putidum]TWI75435.1 putative MATE family efflux protein [Treponema putidum]UTY29810.1 MATE family efflux transporter [Treponema putidum]UTY32265.1 MATE family efflux transporter [Treponema putidum]UTY34666.1 MATE family efflux transporter [Treponema putidum]